MLMWTSDLLMAPGGPGPWGLYGLWFISQYPVMAFYKQALPPTPVTSILAAV